MLNLMLTISFFIMSYNLNNLKKRIESIEMIFRSLENDFSTISKECDNIESKNLESI